MEQRPYPNTLTFQAADTRDFLTLIRFKAPQLAPAAGRPAAPADIEQRAADLLQYSGSHPDRERRRRLRVHGAAPR